MDEAEELAWLARLLRRTSSRLLRFILVVAWVQARVSRVRRDEGWQRRINLVRVVLRERRRSFTT